MTSCGYSCFSVRIILPSTWLGTSAGYGNSRFVRMSMVLRKRPTSSGRTWSSAKDSGMWGDLAHCCNLLASQLFVYHWLCLFACRVWKIMKRTFISSRNCGFIAISLWVICTSLWLHLMWSCQNFCLFSSQEWKKQKEEDMKAELAMNNRYKMYRRYLKKGGPGQMTFGPD